MKKDPYREMAEQHKQPLEKVQNKQQEDKGTPQRPVKEKGEKKRHYPLLTALLICFIALPFLAVYVYKEDKPPVERVFTEQHDTVNEETAQDAN
ncbi:MULTISPECIES: hypothetical protein [Bacillaceae]|uniref:Uncharacterized protein n=1 Tax=Domibacillus aminovorans TaxID=29332 RepID=A0A177KXY5_9BACI|nr:MULTISPECIES: hypothetical protein [Bacillaceae]OAH55919.1 hypothetical protein AWH48_04380 [Domibacillus aminovorans]OAH58203.1 hypothetical protein AWH49_05810 [Domibacillus aminovorans]